MIGLHGAGLMRNFTVQPVEVENAWTVEAIAMGNTAKGAKRTIMSHRFRMTKAELRVNLATVILSVILKDSKSADFLTNLIECLMTHQLFVVIILFLTYSAVCCHFLIPDTFSCLLPFSYS